MALWEYWFHLGLSNTYLRTRRPRALPVLNSVVSHERQKCPGWTSVITTQWQNLVFYARLEQKLSKMPPSLYVYMHLYVYICPFSHILGRLPQMAGGWGTVGLEGAERKPSHFAVSVWVCRTNPPTQRKLGEESYCSLAQSFPLNTRWKQNSVTCLLCLGKGSAFFFLEDLGKGKKRERKTFKGRERGSFANFRPFCEHPF